MSSTDVVIVGGGISGLSAMHYLRNLRPDLSVKLFEGESRLGGTIGTDHIDGYSFDYGPNGFLDREPLTLALCDELGLKNNLERAGEKVSNRFILRGGRLRSVPSSPVAFMKSDILSVKGRLRILGEPFAKSAPDGIDESIHSFVSRRIGKEAAKYLVQPMVSGVFGGLADELSLESCFPIMSKMEREYGSLIKAMIAKSRAARKNKSKTGGPGGPGGWLTSFQGGLSVIIDSFKERYSELVTTGKSVSKITKAESGYYLTFEDGDQVDAKCVVLAVPSYCAASIVEPISPQLSQELNKIVYAPISVVCFGYSKENVNSTLDGFGFLVPPNEEQRILGSIWTSSIFNDRAPEGKVQFRTMVGGSGDFPSTTLTDNELIDIVKANLDSIIGLKGDPELVRLYRWKQGIPQFRIGHGSLMKAVEKHLASLKGLHIAGNAYYGISLNDCVKQSHRVALNIAKSL